MLSNLIDRHLVTTNIDLDGCKNYGSTIGGCVYLVGPVIIRHGA